ncbi:1-(5-phosphoribosyl)-5-[(5-phosphoribosylamino)methylideneamino]imidazole-4-carboxamide isomerase [Flammeovirga kamogawensis]|uniref:1-(5-phosphoribosyl)-5-[(5- phosphoribosylamino)methylideneamino]imidazole-4- carboxamide isomerase n=1 Tax=Flammeovirga kamogawensis TaxID=373891 RepID=UPI00118361CA|nr:1-(5-phosphoribosyl)-5-[(5-phosphoribosylamino)methylideneamino]imidazole-4-carboxamide isomerase [Flammeovirga kamogawensis]MBB6459004.1 phosphoribosylformimino-5-aminoimidazole carboxamide ribotide isomerase [Flammeovirga kamogawensis]TRX66870.1 1-(5-phosphoribosyl)-5-[(5-phosphoribosylamino)methylideneamino]imidazole-4-carboxamide isomerase [Flammeovirga kamogawensis]
MSHKIDIIPAIDLIDGKLVRLSQGDYAQKTVYAEDPLEVAKSFEDAGIKRLHLVDLDGAKVKHVVNYGVLDRIVSNTSLIVDFGGGIQSDEDLEKVFDHGAAMVTCGSIAVKEPEKFTSWIEKFGSDRMILAADAKDKMIAVSGWQEDSKLPLFDYLKDYTAKGITKVLCTDISKDGMMQGPNTALYKEVMAEFPNIELIASGGVSKFDDLIALEEAYIPSVVVGKAIYENTISIEDIYSHMSK